ncbi:Uncharacterized protein APZ42_032415 [Daphnia magna]|uniref:RNA-directed DNA polymerase n=1 Tax=Daphnia magna TaxID=35525 RepID=A0A164M025_9CRUS|nr:Uncharacterized protein APZ42_032415 [Daphnia magna]
MHFTREFSGDCFTTTAGRLGQSNIVQHQIDTGNHPPVHQAPYKSAWKEREIIQEQVKYMQLRGVIEPSGSAWATFVVLLQKKVGGWRFRVDYRKLNAITTRDVYPLPKKKVIGRTLKNFIGLCSYYRRFIPNFATMAWPLTNLTKKDQAFHLDQEHQDSFARLQHALQTAPVLGHPNYDLPMEIHCDACGFRLVASLIQCQEGGERVVAYANRFLDKVEANYSLQGLDIEIVHRRERLHTDAEAFSRYSVDPPEALDDIPTFAVMTVSQDEIRLAQQTTPRVNEIISEIGRGDLNHRNYQRTKGYELRDGILYHRRITGGGAFVRLCLPVYHLPSSSKYFCNAMMMLAPRDDKIRRAQQEQAMQAFSSVAIFCDRQSSGLFDDWAVHLEATLYLGNLEEARKLRLMRRSSVKERLLKLFHSTETKSQWSVEFNMRREPEENMRHYANRVRKAFYKAYPLEGKLDAATTASREQMMMDRFFQMALINETSHTIVLPRYTTLGHVSFKPRTRVASCSNQPSNLPPDIFEASLPNVAEDVKNSLRNLLLANQHVFVFKTSDLGHTGLVNNVIDTQGMGPIRQRPYRAPPHQKEASKKIIEELLANNIIRPSIFPLTAPIVFVKQKTGDNHLCIDYRKLNAVTIKAPFLYHETTTCWICCMYLGHILSAEGVTPDPSKVDALAKYTKPRTVKGFSTIVHPLLCQTKAKPNDKVAWGRQTYPDFSKEFLIYIDASDCGLGAVLSQMHNGKDKPIAYASRYLNKAEVKYSTIEKEAVAVIFGIKRFRHYLQDEPFVIVSDHRPLQWLQTFKDETGILGRLSIMLANLKYSMKYRPGRVHENVDFLSRIPVQSEQVAPKADDTMFREGQKDPLCCNIKDSLENGTLSEENSTPIWGKEINLHSISNGLLVRHNEPTSKKRAKTCNACTKPELALAREQQRAQYDKCARQQEFGVGDKVLIDVRTPMSGTNSWKKSKPCELRIIEKGLGVKSTTDDDTIFRIRDPEKQLDFIYVMKNSSVCGNKSLAAFYPFLGMDKVVITDREAPKEVDNTEAKPNWTDEAVGQVLWLLTRSKIENASHTQYIRDFAMDISNHLAREIRNLQCESRKAAYHAATMTAQYDSWLTASHLDLPICTKLLAICASVSVPQCYAFGTQPKVGNQTISVEGWELTNTHLQKQYLDADKSDYNHPWASSHRCSTARIDNSLGMIMQLHPTITSHPLGPSKITANILAYIQIGYITEISGERHVNTVLVHPGQANDISFKARVGYWFRNFGVLSGVGVSIALAFRFCGLGSLLGLDIPCCRYFNPCSWLTPPQSIRLDIEMGPQVNPGTAESAPVTIVNIDPESKVVS